MKLLNVTKKYGEVTALDGVSVTFEQGTITAVLGESGAGKTTLLRAIAGLIPCEGTVEGVGRVSYIFQEPKLLPNLTAEDNCKFVLPKNEWGRIGDMLARVGLEGKAGRYPHELSGGERQRVALARALLFPHDVLFMDEPFSSLDLGLKISLYALVLSLQEERGETVVLVTHDVHEAVLLASRALVLKRGKLVCDLPVVIKEYDFFAHTEEEEKLVRVLTES